MREAVSYKDRMSKEAISVTIETENLLWLRGQVRAGGRRSVSAVLDRLVSEARTGGRVHAATVRSVVGTVSIGPNDPDLTGADTAVRAFFPLPRNPPAARKRATAHSVRRQARKRRG